jgi:hypothetical protein
MTRRLFATLFAGALLLLAFGGGSAQAAFGITTFEGSLTGPGGGPLLEAGAHPDFTTLIQFPKIGPESEEMSDGSVRDIDVRLPPGLIGDPSATPKCAQALLTRVNTALLPECPTNSQVGYTLVHTISNGTESDRLEAGVYNMEPPQGVAAQFAFNAGSVLVFIDARLANNGGYHLEARISNVSQALSVVGDELTLWGVPAEHAHDAQRFNNEVEPPQLGVVSTSPHLPFLSNPTSCPGTPAAFHLTADSWEQPGLTHEAEISSDQDGNPFIIDRCDGVPFEASIKAQPTSHEADSPTGLDVTLTVPQNHAPGGVATADLKDVTVSLPAGLTVNPASVNGLGSCGPDEINLDGEAAASCPESSKLGTVEIETPLLEKPLDGSIYLAKQGQNKFGSLLAVYIAVDDPATGTVLKLPGKIAADGSNGRVVASFEENPQIPFEVLRADFFGGPTAPLRTPSACGTYTTSATLTPWSGNAPVTSSDSFKITGNCAGGFSPKLEAASANPLGGRYSPLGIDISRPDGQSAFERVSVALPEGLVAKLAGVPYCPDSALAGIPSAEGTGAAQLASPSCPAASQVGTVTAGAGAGPSPFYLNTGKVYLAGPYKGAPVSLAIVTPAVAGPFDLGNVVVRAALQVDPETVDVTAVSDPIPTILDGIPLDLRDLRVEVNRPDFTLNPTNCSAKSFGGSATAVGGAVAPLSAPFEVAGCEGLGFAPKLALSLKGKTTRGKDPALTAVLTAPTGEANISKVQVVLPKSEFIDQAHIGDVCTRPQFAARQCPAKSVLGTATAVSPLLAQPLSGKVYLRSNGGERKLPDLVADLNGQFHVVLVGFIDSVKTKGSEASRIRNTFASVPDVPVSKFTLKLQGDKKGLLQNSTNLCKGPKVAQVKMTGQNGKHHDFGSTLATPCGGKGKKR